MKGVLAQSEASHGGRMVIFDIDFGTPEGRMAPRTYAVQAIPTQVFFAADGTDVGRHLGAIPVDEVLAKLGLADGCPRQAPAPSRGGLARSNILSPANGPFPPLWWRRVFG